ncbi:hypothetical protein F441_23157 [Phytophthora nicotianae CJ01A1]|nr:hypothetical protein F441_23157 [Phytophthora nicotianae CJ01A1]ETP27970.1 hypothetical protein F442_22746 [Phytophthora nicotianae P10297]
MTPNGGSFETPAESFTMRGCCFPENNFDVCCVVNEIMVKKTLPTIG